MSRSNQPSGNPSPALQTATQTSHDPSTVRLPRTLRLRGDETLNTDEPSPARRIRWSEDVVDNEGMGKKSSKGPDTGLKERESRSPVLTSVPVCCIYHKARPVGESSSESDSDSSSSDSDSDNETQRRRARESHAHHPHPRGQPHGREASDKPGDGTADACCSDHTHSKPKRRKPSPNAYEKMPKPSKNPSQST